MLPPKWFCAHSKKKGVMCKLMYGLKEIRLGNGQFFEVSLSYGS